MSKNRPKTDTEQIRLELTARLTQIYGPQQGLKNSSVLVPAILKDFTGMLERANIGDTVSETYRTEDGAAEISLQAVKRSGETVLSANVIRRDQVTGQGPL